MYGGHIDLVDRANNYNYGKRQIMTNEMVIPIAEKLMNATNNYGNYNWGWKKRQIM
jgi:hypothetical protein